MRGKELLTFLSELMPSELEKEIKIGTALTAKSLPLLAIDDADPHFIWLETYIGPASEN